MKNLTTTIYVIRHGQSATNAFFEKSKHEGKIDFNQWGELQSPLTPIGINQAHKVAKKLRPITFAAIFSSDLNRARETAEIIAKKRSLPVTTISAIRERDYGASYYSLSKKEKDELKKAVISLNEEEQLLYKFSSDGESAQEAINRFEEFLQEIAPVYEGKTIAVVNHGNVMRMFLVHIGWAKYSELLSGAIENTGYFVLRTNGKDFKVIKTEGIKKTENSGSF